MTVQEFMHAMKQLAREQPVPVFAIDIEPDGNGIKIFFRFKPVK